MWKQVHPLSYRVIQTLFFHGAMAVYGFLVLMYERDGFSWKKCYRDLLTVSGMTLWALFGNTLYNNTTRLYNWSFVVRDPFYLLPGELARFVMPVVMLLILLGLDMLLYAISKRRFSNK